jgi:heat shock protein HtpX
MFNWMKTAILMAGITTLFGVMGALFGGQVGMLLALGFAIASNVFAYWFSDKMVLKMYNAQPVDESTEPQFYAMVRELAQRANLPMPKVYLIDEAAPNAFATGRNPDHAAVAATTGLMRMLNRDEIRAVMAHELAHVKHRDILISTIAACMAAAISTLANYLMFFGGGSSEEGEEEGGGGGVGGIIAILVMTMLFPFAAMLIQMAISRSREYEADRLGAEICGDPAALASALAKISSHAKQIPMPAAERHPETAQMMIMNPLSGGGLRGLFSTHPNPDSRIDRLMKMAAEMKTGLRGRLGVQAG